MKKETFERELRYQAMMDICRTMAQQGVLSADDLTKAERYLREKYSPLFPIS